MSRAAQNSQAALDWAKKKKEQMERARKIREERKQKMQMAAESSISANGSTGFSDFNPDRGMDSIQTDMGPRIPNMNGAPPNGHYQAFSNKNMPSYNHAPSNNFSQRDRGYGSSNYRPSSNEEIAEARQSLMLLKSKIKNKSSQR